MEHMEGGPAASGSAKEAMGLGMCVLTGVRAEYVKNRDGVLFVSVVDHTSGSGRAEFPVGAEQVFPSETGMFGYKAFDVVLGMPGDVVETVQTARNRTVVRKEAGELAAGFDPDAQVGWRGGMAPKYMVAPSLIDRGPACLLEGVRAEALSPEAQGRDGPFRLLAVGTEAGTAYVPVASCRVSGQEGGPYGVFLGYGPDGLKAYGPSGETVVGAAELARQYGSVPQSDAVAPENEPDVSLAPDDAWLHGVRGKYVGSMKDAAGHSVREVSVADGGSPTRRSVFAVEPCCVVDVGGGRKDVLIGGNRHHVACAVGKDDAVMRDAAGIMADFDLEGQIEQAVRDGTAVLGPDGRPTLARLMAGDGLANSGKECRLEGVRHGSAIPLGGGTWLVSIVDWDSPGGVLRFLSDGVSPHPGEPAGSYDVDLGAGWDLARASRAYVQNGYIAEAYAKHRQDGAPAFEMPEGHGGFTGMTGANLFDVSWEDGRNRGRIGVRVPDGNARGGYGYLTVPLSQVSVADGKVAVDLGELGHSAGRYKWKDKDGDVQERRLTVKDVCEYAAQFAGQAGVGVEQRPSGKPSFGKPRQAAPEGKSVNLDPASVRDFNVKDVSQREEKVALGGTMGRWARTVRMKDGSYALRGVEAIRMQSVPGTALKRVYVRDPASSSKLTAVAVDGSKIVPEPDRNTYTVKLGRPDRRAAIQTERDGKKVAGSSTVGGICAMYDLDCAERSAAAKTCRVDGLMPGRDVFGIKDTPYCKVRLPDSGVPDGYGELVIRRDALEADGGLLSLKLGLADEVLVGYRLPGGEGAGPAKARRATVGYLMDESSKESFERRKEAEAEASGPAKGKKPSDQPAQPPKSRGREVWLSEIPKECLSLPRVKDGVLVVDIQVPDPVSPYGVGVVQVPRAKLSESVAGIEAMIGYSNEAVENYAVYERFEDGGARRAYCLRTAGEIYEAMKDGRETLVARAMAVPEIGAEPQAGEEPDASRDVTD